MAAKFRLTPEERDFFSLVNDAVLANPFSDRRVETDLKIVGRYPDVSLDQLVAKAVEEVGSRIRELEAHGRCDIQKYLQKDHQILFSACLFDIFYAFVLKFDQLIQDQIAAGEKSIRVPYAEQALSMFEKRGFERADAIHYFALFYQLRRAFYFINRSLVGRSPCMKKLRERLWNNVFTFDLDLYNRYLWNQMEDFSTLILGETGSGKGAAAMAIGRSGYIPFDEKRGCFAESFNQTFVSLNLSQFPENLIESELFGHRKGAFTGAVENYDGIFEQCSPHGSIFLDEIGEVSPHIQIKLLKVLEERLFSPVGSHEEKRFAGRVIAATNRRLDQIQNHVHMREDFFYRLCSDVIIVPPLRQRIEEDAVELDDLLAFTIERITGQKSDELVKMTKKIMCQELKENYSWPGNVRELGQCVRRILLNRSYKGEVVAAGKSHPSSKLSRHIETGEIDARELLKVYCKHLYERYGNYGEVARRTKLDRRTVKKYVDEDGEKK